MSEVMLFRLSFKILKHPIKQEVAQIPLTMNANCI